MSSGRDRVFKDGIKALLSHQTTAPDLVGILFTAPKAKIITHDVAGGAENHDQNNH